MSKRLGKHLDIKQLPITCQIFMTLANVSAHRGTLGAKGPHQIKERAHVKNRVGSIWGDTKWQKIRQRNGHVDNLDVSILN